MKDFIADRAKLIDASGIRKVFTLAASLKDPVNFSIGQPDFDVPESLKQQAGFRVINEYGGYDFSKWHQGSDKWIIECVKSEKVI